MRVGDYVGGYRLMRLLAQGGMGVVYEALNEQLNRRVAVKLIHPALARDREQCARFFNEARVVNLIRHPGLVGIHEHGQLPDGNAYIVMEYLDGQTLSQRVRSGDEERLPVSQVVRIVRQVAAALVAVHSQNVVHRDLKPDNLMLIADPEVAGGERVKILDFGIAKVGGQQGLAELSGATKKGNWLGTPGYMAPEQIYGASSVDGRADVYSLGVILYELLVGHRPFYCGSLEQEMRSNMTAVPPPLLEEAPATPLPLAGLVHSMLAKEPEARPRMHEVVELLHSIEGSTTGAVAVGQAAPRPVALPSFTGIAVAIFLLAGTLLFAGAYSGTGAGPGSAPSGPQPSPARLDAGIVDLASPPAPPERPRLESSEAPFTGVADLAAPAKPTQSRRGLNRRPAAGKELVQDAIYQLN